MKISILLGGLFVISGAAALATLGVQSNSTEPPSSQAVSDAPADRPVLETVTLNVPGMMCEFACAPHVRKTLAAVPGVNDVTTNVENRTATITVASGFKLKRALAKLDEAGYPAKLAE